VFIASLRFLSSLFISEQRDSAVQTLGVIDINVNGFADNQLPKRLARLLFDEFNPNFIPSYLGDDFLHFDRWMLLGSLMMALETLLKGHRCAANLKAIIHKEAVDLTLGVVRHLLRQSIVA
jgi:hypothetical protein